MTWQQLSILVGSTLLCIGSLGEWQRSILAILFFAANVITFLMMKGN